MKRIYSRKEKSYVRWSTFTVNAALRLARKMMVEGQRLKDETQGGRPRESGRDRSKGGRMFLWVWGKIFFLIYT